MKSSFGVERQLKEKGVYPFIHQFLTRWNGSTAPYNELTVEMILSALVYWQCWEGQGDVLEPNSD